MDGGANDNIRTGVSRAAFFGRHGATPDLRPPWSAAAFATLCDGCGRCVPVCPSGILIAAERAQPIVDFRRGTCTFCAACVEACPTGALKRHETDGTARPPWRVTAGISTNCLSVHGITCRLCETHCEPGAIRFKLATGGRALPIIEADRCTGCGACVTPCPARAIAVKP